MTESPIVNEWMALGNHEGRMDAIRKGSITILNKRFPGRVPPDVVEMIDDQPSLEILNDWLVQVALLETPEEISAYLRR